MAQLKLLNFKSILDNRNLHRVSATHSGRRGPGRGPLVQGTAALDVATSAVETEGLVTTVQVGEAAVEAAVAVT